MKLLKKIGSGIFVISYILLVSTFSLYLLLVIVKKIPLVNINIPSIANTTLIIFIIFPLFLFNIKLIKFSIKRFFLWEIGVVTLFMVGMVLLPRIFPKMAQAYCQNWAEDYGQEEARKKSSDPNSDVYWIVNTLTKQRVYQNCMYHSGLSAKKPNGWHFDWLPDVN